jgi:hypothetical protein
MAQRGAQFAYNVLTMREAPTVRDAACMTSLDQPTVRLSHEMASVSTVLPVLVEEMYQHPMA